MGNKKEFNQTGLAKYLDEIMENQKNLIVSYVDFGRFEEGTKIYTFNFLRQEDDSLIKTLSNVSSIESENILEQAIKIRKLYDIFIPDLIVFENSGFGISVLDILTFPIITEEKIYVPLGVINDEKGRYKEQKEKYNPKEVIYLSIGHYNLDKYSLLK